MKFTINLMGLGALWFLFSFVLVGCPGFSPSYPVTNPLTPTVTPTNTPSGPTPTPSATSFPMGNFVGAYVSGYVDPLTSPVTGTGPVAAWVCYNQKAVTNATVVLTEPGGGTVPFTYALTVTYTGYTWAGYSPPSATAVTYEVNAAYSISVDDAYGNVSASLVTPGDVSWSGSITTTLTATAAYPGSSDGAQVELAGSNPAVYTYQYAPNSSVGSPFNFPSSAFSGYSSPVTFDVAYTASVTQTSFTGGAMAAGSYFSAVQDCISQYNK